MTPPKIIGLCGAAGAGKDTVREMLEREHDYRGMAFADPIRTMLGALLAHAGMGPSWMEQRELKERAIPTLGVSYRELAQTLGTEWGRQLHPDFWLRVATLFVEDWTPDTRFVLSDVRFANEAAWVRQHGGEIWRIERAGLRPVRDHISERGNIQADRTLYNDSDMRDLQLQVRRLLQGYPQASEASQAA
jgi:hypothetical protein